jgi:very-short-patch-repair endonuclease
MAKKQGCLWLLFGWLFPKDWVEDDSDTEISKGKDKFPYHVRDDFLSPAEFSFYKVIKGMMKDFLVICPKVSLAELLYVDHPNENQSAYARIRQKRVDFVICDPTTMKPKFAIELDDASHNRDDRIARDVFVRKVFEAAGLPLVRIPARAEYNTNELGEVFKRAMALTTPTPPTTQQVSLSAEKFCPKCGGKLVLRTAQKGANQGRQFWGCSNYPKCTFILPSETEPVKN